LSDRLRVLFMHGLESSPMGDKARYLATRFDATTPAMDTRAFQKTPTLADPVARASFELCVAQQARAIVDARPDVVVGSSFGGAIAVLLLSRGAWRGPTLLLAQASDRLGVLALPMDVPVLLVHGTKDDVVDIAGSRRLARTGTSGLVRLIEVDDGHRLSSLLEGERLADLVREVHAMRPGA
jgi:pimeloyl-ACP methyl ester carboxylesterase